MDYLSLKEPIFLDNLLDEDLRLSLLRGFPSLPSEMRQLRPEVLVPAALQRRILDIVEWCIIGDDPSEMDWKPVSAHDDSEPDVSLPGKIAVGSSRAMHQDTRFDAEGKLEETVIHGYIAVLYLRGGGQLVFDSGCGERGIEAKAGRLIVWLNDACKHRVECSKDGLARSLIGPMHVSPEGLVQAVGHMGTQMEAYRDNCLPAPPPPKPDVMITVTKDGDVWSCTMMSGSKIGRVPCQYERGIHTLSHTLEGLRHLVLEKCPNKDVNVVLLDASGQILTNEAMKSGEPLREQARADFMLAVRDGRLGAAIGKLRQ